MEEISCNVIEKNPVPLLAIKMNFRDQRDATGIKVPALQLRFDL